MLESAIGIQTPIGVANPNSVKKGQARQRRVLPRAIAAFAAPSNAELIPSPHRYHAIARFEQDVSITVLQLHFVLISTR
jgi:hypothetical protein